LLVLRATIGGALLWQATAYWRGESPASIAMGVSSLIAAALLISGLGTPVVAMALVLRGFAIALRWLPTSAPPAIQGPITAAFGLAIMAAIALLGPGSFSIDARIFGRRRIIIPLHNATDLSGK
jgi:hypothetical protein